MSGSSETPGMSTTGGLNHPKRLSERSWGSFEAFESPHRKLVVITTDETLQRSGLHQRQ